MSLETTKKNVVETYPRIISVGYCELQDLLRYKSPIAYTHGIYGWNADVYHFETNLGIVALVTGYRPFGNIHPDYNIIRVYEEEARTINNKDLWKSDYNKKWDEVNNILNRFIERVIELDSPGIESVHCL